MTFGTIFRAGALAGLAGAGPPALPGESGHLHERGRFQCRSRQWV